MILSDSPASFCLSAASQHALSLRRQGCGNTLFLQYNYHSAVIQLYTQSSAHYNTVDPRVPRLARAVTLVEAVRSFAAPFPGSCVQMGVAVTAMRTHAAAPDVVKYAVWFLSNLAYRRPEKSLIAVHLPAVLTALSGHVDDVDVERRGVQLLVNLAAAPDVRVGSPRCC